MKYGLMSYKYTVNIGNEIQSIASRRFLPKIDYYIDHEEIHEFNEDKDVKLIMNGWYLDSHSAWPPSENIDPLLISIHFNTQQKTQDIILSDESRDYLTKHGPVGCRDLSTYNFLNENEIDAYFSGCLTLTLDSGNKNNQKDENNSYVLVSVDNPEEIVPFLKQKTNKKIYVLNQQFLPAFDNAFLGSMRLSLYNRTSFYTYGEKTFIAENFLRMYENADCVITDRLHGALPCLALQTPVLLFNSRQNQERFDGLNDLFNRSSIEEYMENYNIFDVENPCENPKNYLKIRKNLIEKCRKFTGHVNDSCYSECSYNEMLDENTLLISKHSFESRKYIKEVLKKSREYERTIKRQERQLDKKTKQIERYRDIISNKNDLIINQKKLITNRNDLIIKQKKLISDYENSTSWRITAPLRKIKK